MWCVRGYTNCVLYSSFTMRCTLTSILRRNEMHVLHVVSARFDMVMDSIRCHYRKKRVRKTELESAFGCAFVVVGFPDPPHPLLSHSSAGQFHTQRLRTDSEGNSFCLRSRKIHDPSLKRTDAIGDMPQTPRDRASSDVFVRQKMN